MRKCNKTSKYKSKSDTLAYRWTPQQIITHVTDEAMDPVKMKIWTDTAHSRNIVKVICYIKKYM